MLSFKARLITYLFRHRHLFQGKLRKRTFDLNTSIDAFRDACEKGAARFGKLPEGIQVKKEMIGGFKAEWIKPLNAKPGKLIFYVHGGGYVSGSCNDHRTVVAKVADLTGITNLLFEYRLAPEFPFPYALNDSLEVYRQVLNKGFRPENILIMGESAGGGLSFALLLTLKQKGISLPKAAVAISPWTDLTLSGESYVSKNKKSVAPLDSWKVFSHHYIGDADARNPLISPLYGNLKGFPPLFINSAVDDELFDDGKQFFEKAKVAGVDAKFTEGKGMVHCYPLLSPLFKEAKQAMDEIVEFIKFQLSESK